MSGLKVTTRYVPEKKSTKILIENLLVDGVLHNQEYLVTDEFLVLLPAIPLYPPAIIEWVTKYLDPEMKSSPTKAIPEGNIPLTLLARLPGLIPDDKVSCPILIADLLRCQRNDTNPLDMVIHLNDGHGWSREQIADWLDTLDLDLSFS